MRKFVCVLAAALAGVAAADPYGICAHVGGHEFATREKAFALMKEAGIGYVRADFAWDGIQRNAESWNYERLDALMASVEAAQMRILPILDYNASFANPAWRHVDLWLRYVSNTVSRYQARIPVWEVWNEQDINQFWKDPNPTNYLALLKPTYAMVKAVNPRLQVAVGGYAGIPLDYIEELYKLGGKDCFDIMNIHPYSHPTPPEADLEQRVHGLRQVMEKYGDAKKPIWVTELGWPTQKQRLAVPGMLRGAFAQLKKDPAAKWRVLAVCDPHLPAGACVSQGGLEDELQQPVRRVTFDELLAALDADPPDAVVLPVNESFPADERIVRYVRDGGVLVSIGGMPFYYGWTRDPSGAWRQDKSVRTGDYLAQLRIDGEAWWYKRGYAIPEKMTVSGFGKDITCERFLRPSTAMKQGDSFIPLMSGVKDGYNGVGAAIIKYGSDMKGAVVVSALRESGMRGSTEDEQARLNTRANLMLLQMGIAQIFNYEFHAPESDDLDQESHFGIVHKDLSPKPAFHAYKTLTTQRPKDAAAVDAPWQSVDGALYFPQWKTPDGKQGGAIWAYKRKGNAKLTFASPRIKLTSYLGAEIKGDWRGSTCTLPLDDAPVYFSGGALVSAEL
ncbi:MAG: beta-galactosidase [Kiritimatiellaeota bacterium]|nr:beta-galactosidase [Kiritimatiellota bacterium]